MNERCMATTSLSKGCLIGPRPLGESPQRSVAKNVHPPNKKFYPASCLLPPLPLDLFKISVAEVLFQRVLTLQ